MPESLHLLLRYASECLLVAECVSEMRSRKVDLRRDTICGQSQLIATTVEA